MAQANVSSVFPTQVRYLDGQLSTCQANHRTTGAGAEKVSMMLDLLGVMSEKDIITIIMGDFTR